AWWTVGSDVNGGARITLRSELAPTRRARPPASAAASAVVPCIFQLPARIGVRAKGGTSNRETIRNVAAPGHPDQPSRAAIPGRVLPSRNSSEAPPPVEMWLIWSATPAWLTAATESPPPTTVIALDAASARAIAIVPSANAGISKMPIGPFHKTVFA